MNQLGVAAEDFAAEKLAGMGYKILARNYVCRFGEVDIIAEKDGIIAFVEVKSRKRGSLAPGVMAVTAAKQRRIITTAIQYMQRHKTLSQPRFDVFSAILAGGRVVEYDFLEGAFDGGAYDSKHH